MLLTETIKNIYRRENLNGRETLGVGTSQIKHRTHRNTNGRVIELATRNTAVTSYWEDEEVKKEDLRHPTKDNRRPQQSISNLLEIGSYVKSVENFPRNLSKSLKGTSVRQSLAEVGWSLTGHGQPTC